MTKPSERYLEAAIREEELAVEAYETARYGLANQRRQESARCFDLALYWEREGK